MYAVPAALRTRPVHRAEALAAGITRSVLQGPQFRRLHEAVYCFAGHAMTFADRIAAARMALPPDARTTGITRLQELGLDHGRTDVLHFVVEGDHHLQLDGVFLHRTVKMPPSDEAGVSAEAAYIAYCAESRVLDAIKVGCELRRLGLLDLDLLDQLLTEEHWRRGVPETAYVLPHLGDRCRSIPEAELLALVRFSGLPEPAVNETLVLPDGSELTPDQWYARWQRALEYEGGQHQEDRGQYTADIDRYAVYRRMGADYLQVTRELLRLPQTTVRRVHRLLVEGGYDGPPPDFGPHWQSLFRPLRDVVRPRPPGQG
jgi:hypothetical protein